MTKKSLESLLKEFIDKARLEEIGLIDTDSLNFDAYREILDKNILDEGVDGDILWNIFFNQLLRLRPNNDRARPLKLKEKSSFVEKTSSFLKGIPYSYVFYFKLPDDYMLKAETFNSALEIIKTDQKFVDSQEEMNPSTGFDKMLGKGDQKSNHRLLQPKEYYLKVRDKGLVMTGRNAFLESTYSPDRIFGIFLAAHLVIGSIESNKLSTDSTTPKVYDNKGIFRANFTSPIRASRAEHLVFNKNKEITELANNIFLKLITTQSDDELESARVQLCNSLYWYVEYLNNEETSLQLVFLVSAFDSLFPPRKHTVFKSKEITPTAYEKAPTISDVVSTSQKEMNKNLKTLETLFDERNKVIHGKVEIHGYQKKAKKQNQKSVELVSNSLLIYERYIKSRLKKLIS